jgi:hypothetical protein
MEWIAYDPDRHDPKDNREQFNGMKPAWGESFEDFAAKQGIDVPLPGDQISLRWGMRTVDYRRLERPELNDEGKAMTGWYWTVIVK